MELTAPGKPPARTTSGCLVSVVMPTYNRRALIGESIASVLAQTHGALELIIVDDGSSDGTQEAVTDRFGHDPRLRYLRQANRERACARNRGIREARGELIAFLDSDDLWYPDKLARQIEALERANAADCCYGFHDVLSAHGRGRDGENALPAGDILEDLLSRCFIGSMTPLVRRRCFDDVGGFCEDRALLCFEDWEMWTRLASRYRWVLVPEVLGTHRVHDANTQHAATVEIDELRLRLMQSYTLTVRQRQAVRRYASARRWHWATALYRSRPRLAAALLLRILDDDPRRAMQKSFWGLLVRACWSGFRSRERDGAQAIA